MKRDRESYCSNYDFAKVMICNDPIVFIDLPANWSLMDSSRYGVSNNLIRANIIDSRDSAGNALILVEDFKDHKRFNNDTIEMKKYLHDEIKVVKNNTDTILSTKSYFINGWNTVVQKSSIKKGKRTLTGQILSVKGGLQISLTFQIYPDSFEDGKLLLDCIADSYSLLVK